MEHKSQKQSADIYDLTRLAIRRMRRCALEGKKVSDPAPADHPRPSDTAA